MPPLDTGDGDNLMSIGLLFWILVILAVIFNWPLSGEQPKYRPFLGTGLIFVLIVLLGWDAFGPALHR